VTVSKSKIRNRHDAMSARDRQEEKKLDRIHRIDWMENTTIIL
jgi:hypothetical protein